MRVAHLATVNTGGAGIAACRLHDGLLRIGAMSHMYVAHCTGSHSAITEMPADYSFVTRFRRRLDHARFSRERAPYVNTLSPRLELFSDDRVPGTYRLDISLFPAEVYHLHWVAGFVDYTRFFARVPTRTPLVWTLHDMNPMSGGCHYTLGCERFTEHCGLCPQLGSSDPKDLSARIHRRKKLALANLDPATTRFVTASRWMQVETQRSSLLSRFSIERIPFGLDTSVFSPRHKETAREVFGLPPDAPVLLFVADTVSNHRKGFDLLQAALSDLKLDSQVTLAAIGHGASVATGESTTVPLGRIDNDRMMSFAYSAADVFIMPTRAEAFGQVVLESMACGTPVIAFDVGGIPDMIRQGETGLLAPPEDVRALREAIVAVLTDEQFRARLSAHCRRVAVAEYDIEVQARRYAALYETLIEAGAHFDPARRALPA